MLKKIAHSTFLDPHERVKRAALEKMRETWAAKKKDETQPDRAGQKIGKLLGGKTLWEK